LQLPPLGFLKFNIDGASKGNPGVAGYGGAIIDDKGNIIVIFHSHLGNATKNMVEVMAIEQCLENMRNLNMLNTIVEVDSRLTINSIKMLQPSGVSGLSGAERRE